MWKYSYNIYIVQDHRCRRLIINYHYLLLLYIMSEVKAQIYKNISIYLWEKVLEF